MAKKSAKKPAKNPTPKRPRRQASQTPLRRQPSNRQSRRRRPRAGLHRRDARLEASRRPPPRRDHYPHASRREQSGQMELPLLRRRGEVWFLSFHCFAKYVKVAFFRGASFRPIPPGESKQKDVRYLDIREDDATRRSSIRRMGEASQPIARRADVNVRGTIRPNGLRLRWHRRR